MTVRDVVQGTIGRTVDHPDGPAVIVRYEPLEAGMCDAGIRFASGRELWVALRDMRSADKAPLPDRSALRAQADAESLASLRGIRAQLIADWHRPWPGMEFGKAHVGQMIDGAIAKINDRAERLAR